MLTLNFFFQFVLRYIYSFIFVMISIFSCIYIYMVLNQIFDLMMFLFKSVIFVTLCFCGEYVPLFT